MWKLQETLLCDVEHRVKIESWASKYIYCYVFTLLKMFIANKIQITLCLVSIKLFIVSTILCATIYNLMYPTIICLVRTLCVSTNNCSVDLYNCNLLSTTVLFTRLYTSLTEFLRLSCFIVTECNRNSKKNLLNVKMWVQL